MLEITMIGSIARLSLNHERQGNSFGENEAVELEKVLKNKTIKGLVLTGCGTRFFCTGGNLAEQARAKSSAASLTKQKKIRAALERLWSYPHPTIAAINGDCFGGGTELISAFDRVISAPHVLFGFWQRKLGLTFGWGGGVRLKSKLGEALFDEAFTAETFSAYRALDLGLIQNIVPQAELETRAIEWLERVSSLSSFAEFKKLKRDPKLESKIFTQLWMNPTHRKIVAEHKDRR